MLIKLTIIGLCALCVLCLNAVMRGIDSEEAEALEDQL